MCSIYTAIAFFVLVNLTLTSHFSLTIEHVGPILSLAASTSNVPMLDACTAKMSVDIDRTLSMQVIWDNLPEEQLKYLLERPEVKTRDGVLRLRLLCCWVDGGKANDQLRERLDRFNQLLEFVDLASVSKDSLVDILSSNYAVVESRPHQ